MSDNQTTTALTDFDAERDPDDGSVTIHWRRDGRLFGLIAFADGKLLRVGHPDLPNVTTHVEGLS